LLSLIVKIAEARFGVKEKIDRQILLCDVLPNRVTESTGWVARSGRACSSGRVCHRATVMSGSPSDSSWSRLWSLSLHFVLRLSVEGRAQTWRAGERTARPTDWQADRATQPRPVIASKAKQSA